MKTLLRGGGSRGAAIFHLKWTTASPLLPGTPLCQHLASGWVRRRTGWQRPRAGCCKLTGRVAPTRLQLSVTPSAFKVLLLYLLLSSLLFFSKFWREKLIRVKLFLPWNILFKSISPPLSTIDVFYGFFESDSPSPLFYDQRKLNCFKNEWLHESGCLTSIRCGVWNGAVGSGILQMLETRFFSTRQQFDGIGVCDTFFWLQCIPC